LLKAAIRDPNPVVFLEHELMYGKEFNVDDSVMGKEFVLPLGKAKVERAGTQCTIVSFSRAVGIALDAAEKLQAQGVSVEVINLRSLRPLDEDAIVKSAKKTGRVVTLEEGWPHFGVGAEIAAILMESEAFDYLDAPMERVTGADVPMPYSEPLERAALPQVEDVIAAVKRTVARKM
jgi:pyruvate dehydrogenase E1 component beta subunit